MKVGLNGERMFGRESSSSSREMAPAREMEGAMVVVAPGQPPSTERLGDVYRIDKHLGKGGFGTVFSGVRRSDRKEVAIKYLLISKIYEWGQGPKGEVLPMEACLLHKLNYVKGVVKLLQVYSGPGYFALVLDQPNGPIQDLFEYLEGCKVVSEEEAKKIVRQLVRIAMDVSDAGVFHRDIKDENLLYQRDTGNIFLIDFGAGEEWKASEYHTFSGTHMCKPREFLVQGYYRAEPATVWSIGVLTYRLLVGVFPYSTDEDILVNSLNFLSFKDHLKDSKRRPRSSKLPPSSDFIDFVSKCLQSKPVQRARLAELAIHNWLYEDPPHVLRQKNVERALDLLHHVPLSNSKNVVSEESPVVDTSHRVNKEETKVDSTGTHAATSSSPVTNVNSPTMSDDKRITEDKVVCPLRRSPRVTEQLSSLNDEVPRADDEVVGPLECSSRVKEVLSSLDDNEPRVKDKLVCSLKCYRLVTKLHSSVNVNDPRLEDKVICPIERSPRENEELNSSFNIEEPRVEGKILCTLKRSPRVSELSAMNDDKPVVEDKAVCVLERSPQILSSPEHTHLVQRIMGSISKCFDDSSLVSNKSKRIFFLDDEELPRQQTSVSCLPCNITRSESNSDEDAVSERLATAVDVANASLDHQQLKSPLTAVVDCSVEDRSRLGLAGLVSRVAQAMTKFKRSMVSKHDQTDYGSCKAADGTRPWLKPCDQKPRERFPRFSKSFWARSVEPEQPQRLLWHVSPAVRNVSNRGVGSN